MRPLEPRCSPHTQGLERSPAPALHPKQGALGEIIKSALREGLARLPNLPAVIKRRKPLQIKSLSPSDERNHPPETDSTLIWKNHPGGFCIPQAEPKDAGGQAKARVDLEAQQGGLCA